MSTFGGFQELNSVTHVETLTFQCKEFRLIRLLLRLLSLWRPQSAGVFESYFYPFMVNLLLLSAGLVRNTIQAASRSDLLSIQSVYVVHDMGIWLGHILGNVYFRSRDLETNVLPGVIPLTGIRKVLKRRLKFVKTAMIASLSIFTIMLCALYVGMQLTWNEGTKRFSSEVPHIYGTLDHILYGAVIMSIVYNISIGLALAWTMALLHVCFASRLKVLEGVYLKWTKPTSEAVYFFQQVYSRPVKRSWKRISWWFLVHNIIVLAVPLYGYELAQALNGHAYNSKHLAQFVCYLVFVLTVWLAPILMAEQIKRMEKKFQERVNDFCHGLLRETTDGSFQDVRNGIGNGDGEAFVSSGTNDEENDHDELNYGSYTLASRGKELRDFLRFLKKRRLGLVSRGYSMQLNLSLVSLFIGIVSFLIKLNDYSDVTNTNRMLNTTSL